MSRSRRALARTLGLYVLATAVSGCHAEFPGPTGPPTLAGVRMFSSSAYGPVGPGTVIPFTALRFDEDLIYADVGRQTTWISSNPSVATVSTSSPSSSGGLVIVRAAGTVEIRAVYEGFTDSVILESVPRTSPTSPDVVIDIKATPSRAGLRAAARLRFIESSTTSRDVTPDATWTSSDVNVATVERGMVTAIGTGSTTITASFQGLTTWYRFSVYPRVF